MLIKINRLMARRRRTLSMLVATFAVVAAVVLAHGFISSDHMGGMAGMSSPAAICLAVAETAALGLALAAVLRTRSRRGLIGAVVPWLIVEVPQAPLRSLAAPARAGPAKLQVFRL